MKVLITGAFGFVGTNLSAYLAAKGHEVWGVDLLRPRSGRDGDGEKCGNALMRECLNGGENAERSTLNAQRSSEEGVYSRCFCWEELENIPWQDVDAVVHLAGKAHDTRNASDPQSYFDVNVELTKKVIENFSRKDAKAQRKFILFSSVKAVADRVEGVLTETAVPDPKTAYGQSKLEAEREVLKCESSEVRELATANDGNFRTSELQNFRTYILRPCMIHGPGNKGNLNLLYGVVKRGVPWPLGAFENRRSFASIGNVCAVVEGLLTRDVAPGVYQVADDEPIGTTELIGLMAEAAGRRARVWRVPAGLMRLLARIGGGLRLPLDSERLNKLTESYVVSNAKIKQALGWERMPVAAREGMRRTLREWEAPVDAGTDAERRPLFSIVMPVLNAGPFLERALRSVLEQAGEDTEVIVVDGGSTDGSAEVIRAVGRGKINAETQRRGGSSFVGGEGENAERRTQNAERRSGGGWTGELPDSRTRFHWCSERDEGQSAALNKGFARASGKFLLWVNGDDLLMPGTLDKARAYLREHPECRWLAGNLVYIDEQDRVLRCARDGRWHDGLYRNAPVRVYGPTSFFSRELFERVGGLDETLHYLMDTELWLRFRAAGERFERLDHYCWAFRVHGGSKTAGELIGQVDPVIGAERARVYARHGLCVTRAGLWRQRFWRLVNGCYARAWRDTRIYCGHTVAAMAREGSGCDSTLLNPHPHLKEYLGGRS
ncbi:MAG: NAD-dependent epimerase/dehydratase family protein [Kiritimatiellia bacterium]|jgi:nucleoside-diphosphate-sugar epimerase/glycosyltransferase involved in cell wall biosynthesis|nr:NAD-dependent epimerase/dehydratase family protein [Kiritimatiellia bacterium]